jgi:hypothetical protein
MAFTDKQAATRARQIYDKCGPLIHAACAGTGVKEAFLAGFTGVEAAFAIAGPKFDSKRFEKGVYADLISLRDNGFCIVGGKKRTNYNGLKQSQIKDANDAAVHNLATSWGCTQIMGYWGLVLGCTIAELRDADKHFHYSVQLLKIVSGHYLAENDLASVLHIWNTGSANGKTYHEDYVVNALKVKTAYDKLLAAKPFTVSAAEPVGDDQVGIGSGLVGDPTLSADGTATGTEQQPTISPADNVAVEKETHVGFITKIKLKIAGWLGYFGGIETIEKYKDDIDNLGVPTGWIKYAVAVGLIVFLIWLIYEAVAHLMSKYWKRNRTDATMIANANAPGKVIAVCPEDIEAFERAGWTVIRRDQVVPPVPQTPEVAT